MFQLCVARCVDYIYIKPVCISWLHLYNVFLLHILPWLCQGRHHNCIFYIQVEFISFSLRMIGHCVVLRQSSHPCLSDCIHMVSFWIVFKKPLLRDHLSTQYYGHNFSPKWWPFLQNDILPLFNDMDCKERIISTKIIWPNGLRTHGLAESHW